MAENMERDNETGLIQGSYRDQGLVSGNKENFVVPAPTSQIRTLSLFEGVSKGP